MELFHRAYVDPERFTEAYWLSQGFSAEDAAMTAKHLRAETVYRNNGYQVPVSPVFAVEGWPDMIHLSIRRLDRRAIRDWRDMQQIKNMIVGPEHEGVELYPADSRLADSANQYHIWVLADPDARFPFGFMDRLVTGQDELAKRIGVTQRPLRQEVQ